MTRPRSGRTPLNHILPALTLSLVLSASLPVGATTFLALDLAQLSTTADLIVIGYVLSRRAEPVGGSIATRVVLQLDEVIAGTAQPGAELDVIVAGGEYRGVGVRVHGAPRLEMGRRYLIFLTRRGNEHIVVGMAQGALPLRLASSSAIQMVYPAVDLPRLVSRRGGQLVAGRAALTAARPLDQVLALIREARSGH